ncbi:MAG: imidazole glycerol phosphate synthase subunit HisH [Pseudomonadota bacterium]
MTQVAVVDSGANFASVRSALERCGASYTLTHDAATLRAATHVLLPGVGNVTDSWNRIKGHGLVDTLRELTQPVLGICVGMQMMFEHCDEAGHDTLGVFKGHVKALSATPQERVPHCGWNTVSVRGDHALTRRLASDPEGPLDSHVYFVHSFAAPVTDDTLAECRHTIPFAAAVGHANFYGVQFHPERSARTGAAWLRAFLSL